MTTAAAAPQAAPQTPAPTPQAPAAPEPVVVDKDKLIAQLNSENAARRLKEKELSEQLEQFQTKHKTEAEEALAKQGEFKTLYEQTKAQLESVLPKVTDYEKALAQMLEAETALMPEAMRPLIPAGDVSAKLAWIATAKAAKLFETPAGPGVRQSGEPDTNSLEAQLADAEKKGNILQVVSLKRQIHEKQNKR